MKLVSAIGMSKIMIGTLFITRMLSFYVTSIAVTQFLLLYASNIDDRFLFITSFVHFFPLRFSFEVIDSGSQLFSYKHQKLQLKCNDCNNNVMQYAIFYKLIL